MGENYKYYVAKNCSQQVLCLNSFSEIPIYTSKGSQIV